MPITIDTRHGPRQDGHGPRRWQGLRDLYYTLCGVGYTCIAYAVCVYAIAHYACWTLPRCAWLRYTGQIPPPRDPRTWQTHDRESKF